MRTTYSHCSWDQSGTKSGYVVKPGYQARTRTRTKQPDVVEGFGNSLKWTLWSTTVNVCWNARNPGEKRTEVTPGVVGCRKPSHHCMENGDVGQGVSSAWWKTSSNLVTSPRFKPVTFLLTWGATPRLPAPYVGTVVIPHHEVYNHHRAVPFVSHDSGTYTYIP